MESRFRYHVVQELVRYCLGAKRKRPRPAHQNQDLETVEDFPEQLTHNLLLIVSDLPKTSKIRYWCEDKSRFGLKTIERTKITARGVQPIGVSQWIFKTIRVADSTLHRNGGVRTHGFMGLSNL